MFDNISKKIKSTAKTTFIMGIIESIFLGIFWWIEIEGTIEDFLWIAGGFAVILIGIMTAYGLSLLIYGFGQLVENSDKTTKKSSNNKPSKVKDTVNTEIYSNKSKNVETEKLKVAIGETEVYELNSGNVFEWSVTDTFDSYDYDRGEIHQGDIADITITGDGKLVIKGIKRGNCEISVVFMDGYLRIIKAYTITVC